jgi:hypothetical protein
MEHVIFVDMHDVLCASGTGFDGHIEDQPGLVDWSQWREVIQVCH